MNQSNKIDETLGQVKEALSQARKETVEAAGQAYAKGEEVWTQARSKGEEVLKSATEKGKEIFEDVAEEGLEGINKARRYVKRNPGKSLGIALFAGVVLGALLFSQSSKDE